MLDIDELGLSRASPSPDSGLMCDPKNRSGLDVAAREGFIQDWIRPNLGGCCFREGGVPIPASRRMQISSRVDS